jgi:TolB protein
MMALAACTPAGGVDTTSTTEPEKAETTAPASPPGLLLVTGRDGSVSVVSPVDGASEELDPGGVDPVVAVQPTGSHDAGTVVWTVLEEGEPHVGVWTGAGTETFPAPFAPFFYAFDPIDERVAMLGNDPRGGVGLALLDLASGESRSIDVGAPYYLDWSPDAATLGVHIGSDLVGVLDLEGGRLELDGTHGVFQAPDWTSAGELVTVVTPDGLVAGDVVPVSTRPAGGAITAIDPDTGVGRRLAGVAGPASFQLAPSGERLAFVGITGAGGGLAVGPLAVVEISDGQTVEVSNDPVVAYEWSPPGDRLLFLTLGEQATLVPHTWDGRTVVDHAGYAPTGTYLGQYLPFWDQYSRSLTTWAPDGSAFAYADRADDGGGGIVVQDLSGARRDLGAGEFVSWIGSPVGVAGVLP